MVAQYYLIMEYLLKILQVFKEEDCNGKIDLLVVLVFFNLREILLCMVQI